MSQAVPLRAGWCPGALNPMATGDGLIVRIKPRGGVLSPDQARGIAQASRSLGNGDLDLTSRANLQIRGVTESSLRDLIPVLGGLDLLDPSPAAEAVRNIVSSPLAGLDTSTVLDIRPVVAALAARLVADGALHALSAKFSFVIDDGGRLGLADVPSDIRFEVCRYGGRPVFGVRLGGAESEAAGLVAPADVDETAAILIGIFLDARARDPEICRMRHLVAHRGAEAILRSGGLTVFSPPRCRATSVDQFIGAALSLPSPPVGEGGAAGSPAGTDEGISASVVLGAAAPFGRLTARQLEALADAAAKSDAAELRLTPWRAMLVPSSTAEGARQTAAACAEAGLIVDPTDPRLRIAACPGAPGCHRGTTPVLADAAHLAALLEPGRRGTGILLHVSGCNKGCAHAGKAPLTFVGENGTYGLVIDGNAAGRPTRAGLPLEQAARYVTRSARMERQL